MSPLLRKSIVVFWTVVVIIVSPVIHAWGSVDVVASAPVLEVVEVLNVDDLALGGRQAWLGCSIPMNHFNIDWWAVRIVWFEELSNSVDYVWSWVSLNIHDNTITVILIRIKRWCVSRRNDLISTHFDSNGNTSRLDSAAFRYDLHLEAKWSIDSHVSHLFEESFCAKQSGVELYWIHQTCTRWKSKPVC